MKEMRKAFRQFDALSGYFIADKQAFNYLNVHIQNWNVFDLNDKMNVLGLNQYIPDHHVFEVQQLLVNKKIGQTLVNGDLHIFDTLFKELSFLKFGKFILSKLLCAHRPTYFPIWDEQRVVINNWIKQDPNLTYESLKRKINSSMVRYELHDMNYFYFNKFLWYCE